MKEEKIFEQIKLLIHKKTGYAINCMNMETTLLKDIGMSGDDAFEFMQEYKNVFNVDLSEFSFNEYFPSEGVDILGVILSCFKREWEQHKEITIADLVKSATAMTWNKKLLAK